MLQILLRPILWEWTWWIINALPIRYRFSGYDSVMIVHCGLQCFIFLLVLCGLKSLKPRSVITSRTRYQFRLIHISFLILFVGSAIYTIDLFYFHITNYFNSMRWTTYSSMRWTSYFFYLPQTKIFLDGANFGQTLLWFIIFFCSILLAPKANQQLNRVRFSKALVITLLSSSLFLWFAYAVQRSYPYGSLFYWGLLEPVIVVVKFLWLSWLIILFDIARRRVRLIMHCRKCGYNLTGNQTGICPECGMETEVVLNDPIVQKT
ncbi:MAG: hypothetical protein O7G85_01030 [Planctomycetota bacterium]|nr:hypothetical protein [Planctomycetota bacterium]